MQWWLKRAAVMGEGERRMRADACMDRCTSTPCIGIVGSGSVVASRRCQSRVTWPAKRPIGVPAGRGGWGEWRIMTPGPRRLSLTYVRRLLMELSKSEGKAVRISVFSRSGVPRESRRLGEKVKG